MPQNINEEIQETSTIPSDLDIQIKQYSELLKRAKKEISKAVVGQEEVVSLLFEALIANGHVLLEGVPGIGKTFLIKVLSEIIGCSFSRIQFTPDLLPADIIGVTTYEEGKGFSTMKGPVFANFILGDEINRSPPKVQSALLEAMQEKQVTIGKETFNLPIPFFVMATQNPLESLGTYKLPEAQLDRFLFNVFMNYPQIEEEEKVLEQNMTIHKFENFKLTTILQDIDIIKLQELAKQIQMDDKIKKYIVRLVDATRFPKKYNLDLSAKYIDFGTSPRASIALFIASKSRALTKGRSFVTPKDIKEVAPHIFRHRIILNFEGQADNIKIDDLIDEILKKVPLI
ncbi:MAG: MoxR family ATPase [Candidatus Nanoarchaeia archaeon]|nr:MoxR family ATPase [Candidatus Nanoarchaeia archaeon]